MKRALRLLGLGLLIIMALMGAGFTGAVFMNRKEQDYDNELKTELVEGRENEMQEKDQE